MGTICTYGLRELDFDDVDSMEIDINDIAHALARLCRFGGHCKDFYSVAEHSIFCAELGPPDITLHLLLHDAHEAYTQDLVRAVKDHAPGYKDLANRVQSRIYQALEIEEPTDEINARVKEVDDRMCLTEAIHVMPKGAQVLWNIDAQPFALTLPMPLYRSSFYLLENRFIDLYTQARRAPALQE